jgi:small subunit ribosomal protein S15
MARMYSRKKGKSGSKRPLRKTMPSWIRYKPKEAELLVVKLAKEGKTQSEVGLILRDTYGIPNVKEVTGKNLSQIRKEHNLSADIPEDVMALIKKSISLKKHVEKNHKDESARRGITLTESKIKRLAKYYKRIGKLPETWKYQPERVKLYVE